MKNVLSFEDGQVYLDGEELPGVVTALRVDGKVRYDEQQVDGTSGKSKTPQGWEDHTVIVTMVLSTDDTWDCYDRLEALAAYFKTPDAKANPQIYTLANRHAQGRGIRKVVFDRLETSEDNQIDTIVASLGFTEHNPPIVRKEKAAAKTPTPKELARKAEEKAAGKTDAKSADASSEVDDVFSGDLE